MISKKKNGFVIELMIVFMVVSFGFCMVLITYLGSLRSERKYSKYVIDTQTELNQLGEYYLRSIEYGGDFPKGTETKPEDFAGTTQFGWMDDEAKEFFVGKLNEEGKREGGSNERYNYATYFSITRDGLANFYQEKYILRKLIITAKADGKTKMVVDLKEQKVKDPNTKKVLSNLAQYDIENWSIGEDVITSVDDYQEIQDSNDLNILQKAWLFIGLEKTAIENFREADKSTWRNLFNSIEDLAGDSWDSLIGAFFRTNQPY